ncbi:MAG: hypothetical protein GC150_03425 [Rhizobiales bacterium]|nr:hypothetical protein [Hyphomicrobiales bacterium]
MSAFRYAARVAGLAVFLAIGTAGAMAASVPTADPVAKKIEVVRQSFGLAALPADAAIPAATESEPLIRVARRGRNFRRGLAIGVGALVLGTIIANEAARSRAHAYDDYDYRPRPRHRGRDYYLYQKERCAAEFRSFDWETETYITYSGYEKRCPYLP